MRPSKGPEGAQVHGPSKVHLRGLADSWLSYCLSYLGSHGMYVDIVDLRPYLSVLEVKSSYKQKNALVSRQN